MPDSSSSRDFNHINDEGLLTTEPLSLSGRGSCTSDKGSSGFLSFKLGKILDCISEL